MYCDGGNCVSCSCMKVQKALTSAYMADWDDAWNGLMRTSVGSNTQN